MAWYISNLEKKNVTETETWTKDGETLTHETGWRWAKWRTETEPDLTNYDEDEGCDPCDMFDAEMDSTDDGCWEEWTYPDSWTDEDIAEFEEKWDEEWHEAPLNMDFEQDDTILWVRGPLEIAEIDDTASEDSDDEVWEGSYEEPELSSEEEARLDTVVATLRAKDTTPHDELDNEDQDH
jgi:hypothetical protein